MYEKQAGTPPHNFVNIWESRDEELRRLRLSCASKNRAWLAQKKRTYELKKQLNSKQKKIKELLKLLDKMEK